MGSEDWLDGDPERLANVASMKVGGAPGCVARPRTIDEVEIACRHSKQHDLEIRVLGGMSNVIVGEDVKHLSVLIPEPSRGIEERSDRVGTLSMTVPASLPLDDLVGRAVARGAGGIAALACIPGSVGGAVVQNAGAYGWAMSNFVVGLTSLDLSDGAHTIRRMARARTGDEDRPDAASFAPDLDDAIGLGYRTSVFKESTDSNLIWEVDLEFDTTNGIPFSDLRYEAVQRWLADNLDLGVGDLVAHPQHRDAVKALRCKSLMGGRYQEPPISSVGSFFRNAAIAKSDSDRLGRLDEVLRAQGRPEVALSAFERGEDWVVASRLLLNLVQPRLDGTRWGGISLANGVLVNDAPGRATADDVVRAASDLRGAVHNRFGVVLEPEAVPFGFDWPW